LECAIGLTPSSDVGDFWGATTNGKSGYCTVSPIEVSEEYLPAGAIDTSGGCLREVGKEFGNVNV